MGELWGVEGSGVEENIMVGKTFCGGAVVENTAYTSKLVKAQQSVNLM